VSFMRIDPGSVGDSIGGVRLSMFDDQRAILL
jgi:hypothetical protein